MVLTRLLRPIHLASIFALCAGFTPAFGQVKRPNAEAVVERQLKDNAPLVFVFSGDGGWWGDLDTQLGDQFANRGYSVVGLDTNQWFGDKRTPEEAAGKLSRMIETYSTRLSPRGIAVIGWSYGADVIPVMFNRMAPADQAKVGAMAFMALGRSTQMQVTLASRTGFFDGDIPLSPELAKLPPGRVICIYGVQEAAETGCTLPVAKAFTRITMPGSHALKHDSAGITARLLPLFVARNIGTPK